MKKNAVSPQANGLAATDGMPMADLAVIEQASADVIRSRIFTIRGVPVMLAPDLADLYQVETRSFNQSVKPHGTVLLDWPHLGRVALPRDRPNWPLATLALATLPHPDRRSLGEGGW